MLLAAIFLKEPITGKKMAGVVLGIAGALLMIAQIDNSASGKNNLWGIFFAVISVTAFSVYLIIIRSVAQKYTTVTQMKWMFLFAAIILVPLGCTEYSEQALFSTSWGWIGVWELAFVAILATSVAYFLTPFGMKYLRLYEFTADCIIRSCNLHRAGQFFMGQAFGGSAGYRRGIRGIYQQGKRNSMNINILKAIEL